MPSKELVRAAEQHYSDVAFWTKVAEVASRAGRKVCHRAFCLYFAARAPETPVWAKTTVAAALGYFIWPLDTLPDLLPVVGFSDDLGALLAAAMTVAAHIKAEHVAQADAAVNHWLGPDSGTEL